MDSAFWIRVIPNASRNEAIEGEDGILKVRVQAAASEGKANDAVLRVLAKHYGGKPRDWKILSGEKCRLKRVGRV